MTDIRWESYPLVAGDQTARTWLQIQANLQLRPHTIDAYGRSLNDYLDFCVRHQVKPETITREHFSLYVQDLSSRPNPKEAARLTSGTGRGLSNATMQQRVTVVRLYQDYLVEQQMRADSPVRRGSYGAGTGFGGARQRGDIPLYRTLPWISIGRAMADVAHHAQAGARTQSGHALARLRWGLTPRGTRDT